MGYFAFATINVVALGGFPLFGLERINGAELLVRVGVPVHLFQIGYIGDNYRDWREFAARQWYVVHWIVFCMGPALTQLLTATNDELYRKAA